MDYMSFGKLLFLSFVAMAVYAILQAAGISPAELASIIQGVL